MNEIHTPMITVKETFKRSFGIYLNHFGKIALVSVIPNSIAFLLWRITLAVFTIGGLNAKSLNNFASLSNVTFILCLVLLVAVVLVSIFGIVALIYMVVHHEKASLLESFQYAIHFMWRYTIQNIIVGLFMSLGILIGAVIMMIIGIVLGYLSLDIMNAVFIWLTLIPLTIALIFSSMLLFAQYSIIEKNQSVKEALRYSWTLARPIWLGLTARILFIATIIAVVSIALKAIGFLGSLISVLTLTPFAVVYGYVLYADRAQIAILKDTKEVQA